MQVEHLEHAAQLQHLLLAEARSLSDALLRPGGEERRDRLRQQLCNRLNLLALMVSEGRIRPGIGAAGRNAPSA